MDLRIPRRDESGPMVKYDSTITVIDIAEWARKGGIGVFNLHVERDSE
jgi:hypothetical protein